MSKNISELASQIKLAQDHYYNGTEIISDDEYDALVYQLESLDPKHEVLLKVGAEPSKEWKKENHLTELGSLNKVNYPVEMDKWIEETLQNQPVVVVEKLDGLSIGLQYSEGKLDKALLRGNGIAGENILANVLKMQGIVSRLKSPFNGTVRGEIVLLKSNHKKYFPNYSNPRNSASGLSRSLDGKGCEHLHLIVYDVIGDADLDTELSKLSFLKENGFITPSFTLCRSSKEVNDIWQVYQDKERAVLDYEIDGLVVSCNHLEFQASLGVTAMRPKGRLAFKFANQFVKTTVKDITFEVGSMGRVTPICWVEPVNLLGSRIEKASLYNEAYIQELQVDVGADVLICKANEIIPRIEKVVKATGSVAKVPSNCPCCNSDLKMVGENLQCFNSKGCLAQIIGRIQNWISTLDILEWGDKLILKLEEMKLVKSIADLYKLDHKTLSSVDRMGDRSAENCLRSLWSKKEVPLDQFLGGLSIPLVGSSTIRMLMDGGLNTLEKILSASLKDIGNIKGLGAAKAKSLHDGLLDNAELIKELFVLGLSIKYEDKSKPKNGKLSGKAICITGSTNTKRSELVKMIESNGGEFKNAIGKGCTHLVMADPSSASKKTEGAKKLGISIISEDELMKWLT